MVDDFNSVLCEESSDPSLIEKCEADRQKRQLREEIIKEHNECKIDMVNNSKNLGFFNVGVPLKERPTQLNLRLLCNSQPVINDVLLRLIAEHPIILRSIVGLTLGTNATGFTAKINRGFDTTGTNLLLPSDKLWSEVDTKLAYSTYVQAGVPYRGNSLGASIQKYLASRGIEPAVWNKIASKVFKKERGIIWLNSEVFDPEDDNELVKDSIVASVLRSVSGEYFNNTNFSEKISEYLTDKEFKVPEDNYIKGFVKSLNDKFVMYYKTDIIDKSGLESLLTKYLNSNFNNNSCFNDKKNCFVAFDVIYFGPFGWGGTKDNKDLAEVVADANFSIKALENPSIDIEIPGYTRIEKDTSSEGEEGDDEGEDEF